MTPFSSSNLPTSHVVLLQHHDAELRAAYAAGTYEPIILPYHWFGFSVVLAYLLCEPSTSRVLHVYRYLSFAIFVAWAIHCVRRVRSPIPHITYGFGLLNAWAVIWLAALMIFNDIKRFRRIWAVTDAPPEQRGGAEISTVNGEVAKASASGLNPQGPSQQELRERVQPADQPRDDSNTVKLKYYWQPMPTSFAHRVHWMFDLTTSLRAPGWQHQIRTIPAPPKDVLDSLPKPHPTARPAVRSYADTRSLVKHNLLVALFTYLAMDITKNIAMRDPYFWGFTDAMPLSSHPFASLQSPLLLRAYRVSFTGTMVGVILIFIFSLNALVFAGICGPDRFPYLRIRAAPWVYSDWYGGFAYVSKQGLTGGWGASWHQAFRVGFAASSIWLCDRLGWNPNSQKGKIVSVLLAFTLSGIVHATGSYTTVQETRPITGAFLFFFLQGVGVLIETAVKQQLERLGIVQRVPWVMKRLLVTLWVVIWLLATAPLVVDDFAKSGVWLLEPVPFSFVRLFGFGIDGQSAWAWRGRLAWWHQGRRWWQSGIAF